MPAGQRPGPLQNFDWANVAGYIDPGTGMLNMVAQLSWNKAGDPTHYAVVTDDMYGLAGNWTQFDGEVLGVSCGSEAVFNTDAEVVTRVAISSCAGDTEKDSTLCAPPVLNPNVTFSGITSTGETNNLNLSVAGGAVSYANDDLAVVNTTSSTAPLGACIDPKHIYMP